MNFGYTFTFQSLDKGIIERIGPSGFTASIFTTSSTFVGYYSGLLYHTTFVILIFTGIFLTFFVCGSFGITSLFNISFILLILSYTLLSVFDPNNS